MADILNEIEEEFKKDQFYQWWKKYARFVISSLVLVVLATGAYFWWVSYQNRKMETRSDLLFAAKSLIDKGESEPAFSLLDRLMAEKGTYAMLAGFEKARLSLKEGRRDDAIKALGMIANDRTLARHYRDRAQLQLLMLQIGKEDSSRLYKEFEALASPSGAYRFNAREMMAILKVSEGEREAGVAILEELRELGDLPSTMSGRIDEYLKALG